MKKIILILLVITFQQSFGFDFRYDISKPDYKNSLPNELKEVSGLTDANDSQIACVQDEQGILFLYDLKSSSITGHVTFGPPGDYEGLTRVGSDYYVLRSDGQLIELNNPFSDKNVVSKTYDLKLQSSNNEGLCFDPFTNSLLIAAKSKGLEKNERLIYQFDLEKKKCSDVPWMTFQLDKLKADIQTFGIVPEKKTTKAGKTVEQFNFRPASLSIHPRTGDIYIISAADFLFLVVDRKLNVLHAQKLNELLFEKAEGISFLTDQSMIITSEGVNEKAMIYQFNSGKE